MNKKIFLFFVLILGGLHKGQTDETIIRLSTLDQTAVQAAIDSCPADRDCTLILPEGTVIWTRPTQEYLAPAIRIKNKRITLQGQGIGRTNIINGNTGDSPCIGLEGDSFDYRFRITGISFTSNLSRGSNYGIINVGLASFSCKNWRIDHCELREGFGGIGIWISDNFGVVDHCIFKQGTSDQKFFQIIARKPGDRLSGDTAWQTPLVLGGNEAVFIESCTFTGMGSINPTLKYPMIDIDWGSRCVFRYNNLENGWVVSHGGEHPWERGMIDYEVYHNTFNCFASNDSWAVALRGGTGVMFNNWARGFNAVLVQLLCYCACSQGTWGPCKPGPYIYPFDDQVGQAPDANGDGKRDLEPVYIWSNTVVSPMKLVSAQCEEFIKEGRDFHVGVPRPDYIPYPFPHPLSVRGEAGRLLELQASPAGAAVVLSWQAIAGAVNYRIIRDWQEGQPVNVAGNSWTDSPSPGKHLYMVYALDSAGKILAAEGKFATAGSGAGQSISLVPGWNWISFNVLPSDRALNTVFSTILSQVDQVKTQTQAAIYQNGSWIGDLADMNGMTTGAMYKVKVNAACTLTVTGTRIAANTPISLVAGWNWVAYYPETALDIGIALASITGQVLEVRSSTQAATYSDGAWSGTLTQLEPGKGYVIFMNSAETLIYPTANYE